MFGHNKDEGPINDNAAPEPVADASLAASDDTSQLSAPVTITPPAPDEPAPSQPKVDIAERTQVGDNDVSTPAPTPTHSNDDLLTIKKEALEALNPLVDQLDQTPEEKFKTTMMMIQASDDQSLIGNAYRAAQSIKDEKIRAQALLDVINEINYFTQQTN